MSLNDYEKTQLDAVNAWKSTEPGVASQALGVVVAPVAWVSQRIVPEAAVRAAIDGASSVGRWMADERGVLRAGNVSRVEALRSGDLQVCDQLANDVHDWAIGYGAAEGTVTGVFGILAAPIDVPAIITLAMRTIHKIGLCYGYRCETEEDQQFVRGILAASGANSMREKLSALAALAALRTVLAQQTWKLMAKKAAQDRMSREAALVMVRNLAKQIGVNVTRRRAAAAIPAIGAVVGGSVNAWYVKDVGWAARRSFQERWLQGKPGSPPQIAAA